ncbi:hypothetical protein HXX76_000342 [Chlamydomonas incerta]|uniref:C3H1-type domain-containing protein n=1 Tax=Chlamydomonas incerta TaxID=51695 RepID=A0A835WE59_CHLIN|nr:hypothetical protein HXX76_000342 [Chlamydomonas incerta]|eukprot:KAG2445736.1 hypothetical protein HXX76_000342 [Chlamydomonas incerta]
MLVNPRDPHYPNREEWLTRLARRQVDDATLQKELAARGGGGELNYWSGRKLGPSVPQAGRGAGRQVERVREASKYRCLPEADVGRTRGSDAKQHVFCLYFSKGCCSQGSACPYLHRLPTAADEQYAVRDLSADIFGREKRGENEGYRSGAGTLDRDNRTLYINYEGAGSYELPKIRQLVEANFKLWGPINNVYIVHPKNIAFVRYDWRSSAEFAKEAMHKQPLLGSSLGEVVTARWANEDPNPVAVAAQKRAAEEAFSQVYVQSFESLPPEQKRARIQELELKAALKKGTSVGSYPSTDAQFEARERQEREMELLRQQQAAAAAAEDDDIPFIPPDIYEETQRIVAAKQAELSKAQQQGGASTGGAGAGAGAGGGTGYGKGVAADVAASAAVAVAAASGGPTSFGSTKGQKGSGGGSGEGGSGPAGAAGGAAGAAAGGEGEPAMPLWERAWHDPELQGRMRADPDFRERMRKERAEHVYKAAYQAHYHAYVHSYGKEEYQPPVAAAAAAAPAAGAGAGAEGAGAEATEQQQAEYAAWYAQFGEQYAQQYGYGYDWSAYQQQQAAAGVEQGGAAAGAAAGAEGAEGGEQGGGGAKTTDGLSLLGSAYGSDDEDEDGA